MKREEMILACCSDLAGKVRGKAFPAEQLEKRLMRGIGWTPTNVQITCFDDIAETPFGSLGDLVLIPDAGTRVSIVHDDAEPPESFVIGDIKYTDGRPWEFCTRSILKAALDRLKEVAGLELFGAFEHEFQFRDRPIKIGDAFSSAGFRAERPFAEALTAAMRANGITPDTFLREFGSGQFEVTMGPQRGVTIADHAVMLRELARAVAAHFGDELTFTPIRDPAGVGNGVHIHMSFFDAEGRPATYDPAGRHELSRPAGQFIAGVLRHMDGILALTAPSVASYLRLTPHRWSAAFNNLGFRDREAAVRICPVSDLSDVERAAQFNFEFRAADAAASPYLQLAAIVHAGCQGIKEELAVPEASQDDLSLLDAKTLAGRGYVRLSQSLEQALEKFAADATIARWLPEGFVDLYVKHKRCEIERVRKMSPADMCAAYEAVY